MNENEIAVNQPTNITPVSKEAQAFELNQRMAIMYSKSSLVPDHFKNNPSNCMIALNMAERTNTDTLMVMQNLFIIKGNPAWSSQFLIACFNACGKFSTIHYELNEAKTTCFATCTELKTNKKICGTPVSLAMAKAEGWSTKSGSKWLNMPELMLRYRAAAFLIRQTAPEITMGYSHTKEEQMEMSVVNGSVIPKSTNMNAVMAAINDEPKKLLSMDELGGSMESNDAEQSGGDLFKSEGNDE